MYLTIKEQKILVSALRFWSANYSADPELAEIFSNTPSLSDFEIGNLYDKLNSPPAGYIVLNLSLGNSPIAAKRQDGGFPLYTN